ncbi:ABC transporter permease [Oceanobacillus jeddahense]|uniref:Ribose ABC transporter permease n=2 Tax=Oceanobacillus jeddahense TaxID=1462527 RepID=A0ABY5JRR6_9BACI|nr:ribose ABC transporter permease [Oceanobacillus jeddahense]UUI02991.1 ribose ABC transporter permease [Oceanobacillus jeddahense]
MDEMTKKKLLSLSAIQKYGMMLILVLIIIIFSVLSPNFFTYSNFMSMLRQISVIGIIAAGQTLVIIKGGIDLSVGSIVAFAGVVSALTLASTGNTTLAIIAGLLVGALVGCLNGVLISKLKLSPLIVTLASMTLYGGVALVLSDGNPIIVSESGFNFLGQGYVGPIPFPVFLLIAVYLVLFFILRKTIHGQYIYSIGGNEKATKLSGVKVDIHKIIVYTTSGLLAGLAAVILTARLSSASPVAGTGYELDAIAAVILGGTSLFGGRGSVFGTLIGVAILGFLTSGMNLINVSPFYQDIAKGLIILFAVIIDRFINRDK